MELAQCRHLRSEAVGLPLADSYWKVLSPDGHSTLNFILNSHKLLFSSFNKYVLF